MKPTVTTKRRGRKIEVTLSGMDYHDFQSIVTKASNGFYDSIEKHEAELEAFDAETDPEPETYPGRRQVQRRNLISAVEWAREMWYTSGIVLAGLREDECTHFIRWQKRSRQEIRKLRKGAKFVSLKTQLANMPPPTAEQVATLMEILEDAKD